MSTHHFPNPFIASDGSDVFPEGYEFIPPSIALQHGQELTEACIEQTWGKIVRESSRSGFGSDRNAPLDHAEIPGLKGYSIYTGLGGIAFLLLRRFFLTHALGDLSIASSIIEHCDANWGPDHPGVSFLLGRPGIWGLGAVVSHLLGDQKKSSRYVRNIAHIGAAGRMKDPSLPSEILYGRAGYLYAVLFVRHFLGEKAVDEDIVRAVINDTLNAGRAARLSGRPLVYAWHGKQYIGAAHGVAGICHILLQFDLPAEQVGWVHETLMDVMFLQLPSGNFPTHHHSPDGSEKLVQWCHGAAGVGLCLMSANMPTMQEAISRAGRCTWQRAFRKKFGLCHGLVGSCYALLEWHRHCREGSSPYLRRALALATFLLHGAEQTPSTHCPPLNDTWWVNAIHHNKIHGGDTKWSLFEGSAGLAMLMLDLSQSPELARFPAFMLPGTEPLSKKNDTTPACAFGQT